MAAITAIKPSQVTFAPVARIGVAVFTVLAGALVGIGVGLGLPQSVLIMGLLAPFALMLMLARPHWATVVYIVLVYGDLLSILVRYYDMPALARFAGVALLGAALGYRMFVQKEKLAWDRVTLWMLAYGAVVALGLLYARAPELVMSNVVEFARNLFTYLVIINIITTSPRLHAALYALLGAATALASLTIFQWLTRTFDNDYGGLAQYRVSDITGSTEAARPGGTLGDANYYGQLLLIVIPIALYLMFEGRSRRGRLVGLACTGILTAAVILTYSRGDAVALGVMIIAAVIYKRPNPIWLLGGALAVIVAIPLLPTNYLARLNTVVNVAQGNEQILNQDDSILGRTGATQAAIEMFLDHPILGVGRENYPLYQLDYLAGTPYARVAKGIPPHDLYLEVAAENGIVGLFVFGGFLLATLGALGDARRRFRLAGRAREMQLTGWLAVALVGYLVSALSLHGAFLYVLWLQISLIVAARQTARRYLVAEQSKPASSSFDTCVLPPLDDPNSGPDAITMGPLTSTDRPAPKAAPRPALQFDNLWLATAEVALSRRDAKMARSMIELALDRNPYDVTAWAMRLRVQYASFTIAPQVGRHDHFAEAAARTAFQAAKEVACPPHELSGKLFEFWYANGGLPVFGYPICPRFAEVDGAGKIIEVQYFERARLEYRPQCEDTTSEVVPGNLGLEVPVRGTVALRLPHGLEGEQVIFTARGTGMPTPRKFFAFWESSGGPDIFGYPVTPLLIDTDCKGHRLAVQYFERVRLEYHPQLAGTVCEVQVSKLGLEVLRDRSVRSV